MVFIRVWVTDGSRIDLFDTSPASMPFQFGNTGQVSIKFKAGFLAHSFS